MNEENWRVERLEDDNKESKKRLDELEKFQYSTVEKLKTVFERLREIEKSNKWVSQTFFYLLIGGVFSAVSSLIVWLIQR